MTWGLALLLCVSTFSAAAKSVDKLINDLRNGTPQEQVAAADELSRMGEAAVPAIPALMAGMAGKTPWVDLAMMDALASMQKVSLPVLVDKFQNGTIEERVQAGRAFWAMGGKAKEIRPIILKATEDKEDKVKNLAVNVLKKMDSEIAEESVSTAGKSSAVIAPVTSVKTESRDWPGFRGVNRDGICAETGLLKKWPADGPKLLWKIETVGNGYSTISIADGRFFITGDRDKTQFIMAFDLATQKELWATKIGEAYDNYHALTTPTVDGDVLYVISTDGNILCLEAGTGKIIWQKSMTAEFGGKMMCVWKYSESPLIDGDKVICTPGGKDATMTALMKKTGDVVWKCVVPPLGDLGADGAAYSSAIAADIDGLRQYIQVIGRGIVGVAADTGKFLWGYNALANTIASCTSPIARGNYVFTANSYNTGSALLQIKRSGDEFKAEEVYVLPAKTFENHHGGIVLVGESIYGGSGLNKGVPVCLDFASGKVMWKPKALAGGSACVLYADGHVIFRYDRGLTVLVEATPDEFRVKGQFTPPRTDSPAWSYPVIHNKKLYLRDQNLLMCYDVGE